MAEQVHTLNITGMTCSGCSGRIMRVLEATPGVLKADISHDTGSGIVTTSTEVSTSKLVEIVNSVGFEASA
ncbi:MAG: heavy metal-associated domain-containing protein [Candidatus Poseidoniaceae archaeon]|nr:heavy metal-associated domain-containing protein [Candidatus Poseidoniaceae archaeon]